MGPSRKLFLMVEGQEVCLEVVKQRLSEDGSRGTMQVRIENKLFDCEFSRMDGTSMRVVFADPRMAMTVFFGPALDGGPLWTGVAQGARLRIEPRVGPRRQSNNKSQEASGDISSPMPAAVIEVKVQAGDSVDRGQGLVVVSAMKMESVLAAPFDGTVLDVPVAVGDLVGAGQVLLRLARREEDKS